jgi:ribosomal protein S6E (S10)
MIYTGTDRVDDFFAHHGIKGQKWGVRRFETQEGYLTPAGKARYAKYNDGRYDNSSPSKYGTDAASKKKIKANKWQNADGTLTDAGRKRYEKYARQLGYGDKSSMAKSIAKAAGTRLLSSTLRNKALGATIGASKRLVEMSQIKGKIDQNEVNKNAAKMFGGAAVAGLIMTQQHAADKRRKYLIKYADAYGGANARNIAEQAKAARNTTRAISVATTGAAILSKLRGVGSAQEVNVRKPQKPMIIDADIRKKKQLALTMRR